MSHQHLSPRRAVVAGSIALALLATACGSDKKSSSTTGAAPTTAGSATTAASATTATATATAKPAATTAKPGATTTAAAGSTPAASTPAGAAGAIPQALIDAAKKEGTVNLIALPDDWANYKGILASFTKDYGVKTTVANPDASSADELTAVQTLKGQSTQPCAVDIGPAKVPEAVQAGYFESFKPSSYDEIPTELKDPNGDWVAAYYGVMAIGTRTPVLVKKAPTTFADLKDPQYKGQVALNGDPRKTGAGTGRGVRGQPSPTAAASTTSCPASQYFSDLKKSGKPDPHRRQRDDDDPGRDADRARLDVQLPGHCCRR